MKIQLPACLTLSLVLAACAQEKPAEDASSAMNDGTSMSGTDGAANDAKSDGQLMIDPKLAKLCDIPTAYFGFDSASLGKEGQAALDALAACFITGPAKGKSLAVVGHADPRGEPDYNVGLGQRRAGTVETYLAKKGMPEGQIESSSRGELDATGEDEAGWKKDRRVELLLAE